MLKGQRLEHLAEKVAAVIHAKQYRRDGVTPYIVHPRRVVERLKAKYPKDSILVAIGWLHDVLEDSDVLLRDLEFFDFPVDVLVAVAALTHRKDSYNSYVKRLLFEPQARLVKIEDILDNLSDDPTPKQRKKYAKALKILGYKES